MLKDKINKKNYIKRKKNKRWIKKKKTLTGIIMKPDLVK